jgi:hypothetical protein
MQESAAQRTIENHIRIRSNGRTVTMSAITISDAVEIFSKDWGVGPTDRIQSRLAALG